MAKNASNIVAVALIAALCVGGALWWAPWRADANLATGAGKGFFSTDDGVTWFVEDAAKLAPFTKDGREADRAYVFRCGGGKPFVNHLERYKPDAKALLEGVQSGSAQGRPDVMAVKAAGLGGREVKRPGEKGWTSCGDLRAAAGVTTPKCRDGGGEPVEVEP